MADKLTPKREGFIVDVFKGETPTQAYRNNFATKNMADKTIWEASSRLMADSKVAARLAILQSVAAERAQVTVESITKELEEARLMGMSTEQSSAMTAASMGKAKVNGLLVDKVDTDAKLTIVLAADVDDI